MATAKMSDSELETMLAPTNLVDGIRDRFSKVSNPLETKRICFVCYKQFSMDSEYRKHMETHTEKRLTELAKDYPSTSWTKDIQSLQYELEATCSICTGTFKNEKGLQIHTRRMHPELTQNMTPKVMSPSIGNDEDGLPTHTNLNAFSGKQSSIQRDLITYAHKLPLIPEVPGNTMSEPRKCNSFKYTLSQVDNYTTPIELVDTTLIAQHTSSNNTNTNLHAQHSYNNNIMITSNTLDTSRQGNNDRTTKPTENNVTGNALLTDTSYKVKSLQEGLLNRATLTQATLDTLEQQQTSFSSEPAESPTISSTTSLPGEVNTGSRNIGNDNISQETISDKEHNSLRDTLAQAPYDFNNVARQISSEIPLQKSLASEMISGTPISPNSAEVIFQQEQINQLQTLLSESQDKLVQQ